MPGHAFVQKLPLRLGRSGPELTSNAERLYTYITLE